MRYRVTHRTEYRYEALVSLSQHQLHLEPRQLARQCVLESSIEIDPPAEATTHHTDFHGNGVALVSIGTPHEALAITARSLIELSAPDLPAPEATPPWEEVRDTCGAVLAGSEPGPGEYRFDSAQIQAGPLFRKYALVSFAPRRPLLAAVLDLTARIHREFRYDPKATTIATPVAEAFRARHGVCQDFAHVAIACLRSLGLPARYVSGYLETVPPPGQMRLAGADASHAWFAAWCPGIGWIDADPTNNLLPGERHITLAWGRDFSEVSPIRGVAFGGGGHEVEVAVDVVPDSPAC